jgi:hypothetical protein
MIMKQKATFHEILLFTGTTFSSRQFSRTDTYNNSEKNFSAMDELQRACWDGMLYEMFPEILGSFSNKCESFIWHIMNGKNFLSIGIGPVPPITNNETSLDPYFFLEDVKFN